MTGRRALPRALPRALVAGLTLLAVAACDNASTTQDKTPQPRAVVVQKVAYEALTADRSFVGTVRPRIESDLGFRVGGKVAERRVQNGERVRAGQVLALLDTVDLKLQSEQAEAELTAARASLVQAEAEDRRIAQLRKDGWSTQSVADKQRAVVEEARGRLTRSERTVSLAVNALAYAALQADADGVVTATLVEPGQVVAQGAPAIRIARLDAREALAAIPEVLVDQVKSSKATVSLWSEPGKVYAATLRELSASADPATRTYQARFTILDAPDSLEFGLTATVTLTAGASEKIARLPLSALFNQGTGASVYVVNPADGQLTLKPVDVAGYETRDVLVRGGVAEGEQVVTLGVQKLDPRQRVRIVPQQEK